MFKQKQVKQMQYELWCIASNNYLDLLSKSTHWNNRVDYISFEAWLHLVIQESGNYKSPLVRLLLAFRNTCKGEQVTHLAQRVGRNFLGWLDEFK